MIFGVSPDPADAGAAFRQAEGLPFDLLPDPSLEICRLFEVKVTNLFLFKLIERVTFVIGNDGRIVQVVRDTRPADHASSVLCWL